MGKEKVLVISFSDLRFDARVTRQLNWLSDKYDVTCICYEANDSIPNISWQLIEKSSLTQARKLFLTLCLLLRLYKLAYQIQYPYFRHVKELKNKSFAWLIGNDIEALPLLHQFKDSQNKALFDAHEFAPRHLEERLWWRILFKPWHVQLCAKYIPVVDQFTTVSDGLAKEYQQMFNRLPDLVTNATKFHELEPTPLHKPIKLIHHGIVNRTRKIENMIKVAKMLGNDYQLDLIIMLPEAASQSSKDYLDDLHALADSIDNVNILEPMLNSEIVPFINDYDIGLFLLEPLNFNYTFALPNKLFDFVQARLAIAIGPSIEMAKYVNEHQMGCVSEDYQVSTIVNSIQALSREQIAQFKSNTHQVAFKLSEESNKALFLSLLEDNV